MGDSDPEGLGVADSLAVLRRHWRTVVAVLLGVVAAAMAFTLSQSPAYSASVKIAVEPASDGSQLERMLFGATALATQQEILTSTSLIRGVLADHGLPTEESDVDRFLEEAVSVDAVNDANVLRVTVSATDPALAASLAQSVAESYLAYLEGDAAQRTDEATADLDTAEATTRDELRSIEQQLARGAGATRESLEEERDELYAALRWLATRRAELETANAFARRGQIIQPATVPNEPTSPRPIRTAGLALILGSMLGVGGAFLRDQLDDVVRGPGAVRDSRAEPVLAVVPASAGAEPLVAAAAPDDAADSYRRIRAHLLARTRATQQAGLRLVVTPTATDGDAGVVATNLALSLSRGGRSVALVDADLARGTASALLGLSGPGLTEILNGWATDAKAVGEQAGPNLRIVTKGGEEPQAAEQLASSRLGHLLAGLADDVDDIVVVTRSVGAGADALDVAAHGCAVVLVAHPGVTTRDELRGAADEFHKIGAVVVGTVLAGTNAPSLHNRGASNTDSSETSRQSAAGSKTLTAN